MRIRDGKKIGFGIEKIQILDPGWKNYGSGINIPDPQHCFPDPHHFVGEGSYDTIQRDTVPATVYFHYVQLCTSAESP